MLPSPHPNMKRCSLSGQVAQFFLVPIFVAGPPWVSGNSSFPGSPWGSMYRAGLAYCGLWVGVWLGCSVGDPPCQCFQVWSHLGRSPHLQEVSVPCSPHACSPRGRGCFSLYWNCSFPLGCEGVLCAGRGRAPDIQLPPEPPSRGSSELSMHLLACPLSVCCRYHWPWGIMGDADTDSRASFGLCSQLVHGWLSLVCSVSYACTSASQLPAFLPSVS